MKKWIALLSAATLFASMTVSAAPSPSAAAVVASNAYTAEGFANAADGQLAAARGLFKCEAGIACILGTGSNSCFYDGKIIVKNVKAGGYILGDEGSGAVLGKMFLSDVLKGLAPKDVTADFFEKFRISPNEVMESVYNRPFPNRFLSTISYFLADYTNDDYVFELITGNLRNFFTRNVCQYDYKNYPIRFVGSLAYSYAAILREVAREFDIELEIIEETPMNGLIEFHSLNIEEP